MKTLLLSIAGCLFLSVSFSQNFKTLIWSDEFNVKGLPDQTKWNYEEGMKRNHEAQYYTKADLDNAYVKNGHLIIEARKEKMGDANITSASLITLGKKAFLYGRIEVRAKLPMGRGTWPLPSGCWANPMEKLPGQPVARLILWKMLDMTH